MRKLKSSALVTLLVGLSACGSSETERETGQTPAASASGATMSHDLGPFFHIEMEMKERMMQAEGTGPGDSWLRIMIEHHNGGIAMANAMLVLSPPTPVAHFARQEIARQQHETDEYKRLVMTGPADHDSAWMYKPAIAGMHDRMMAVQGADVSETWARKMVEYHRAGAEIAELLLRQPRVPSAIRDRAMNAASDEQNAMQRMSALLPTLTRNTR